MQAVCSAIIAYIAHHRIVACIGVKAFKISALVDITAVIHDAEKIRLQFSHGFCAMLVVIENSTRFWRGGDDLAQKTSSGQRIGFHI